MRGIYSVWTIKCLPFQMNCNFWNFLPLSPVNRLLNNNNNHRIRNEMRWNFTTLLNRVQAVRCKPQWLTMENARTFQFHCGLLTIWHWNAMLWVWLLKIYLCMKTWWKQNDGKRISLKMFENVPHFHRHTTLACICLQANGFANDAPNRVWQSLNPRVCVYMVWVRYGRHKSTNIQISNAYKHNSQQHFATWCEWLYKKQANEYHEFPLCSHGKPHSFAIQRIFD